MTTEIKLIGFDENSFCSCDLFYRDIFRTNGFHWYLAAKMVGGVCCLPNNIMFRLRVRLGMEKRKLKTSFSFFNVVVFTDRDRSAYKLRGEKLLTIMST